MAKPKTPRKGKTEASETRSTTNDFEDPVRFVTEVLKERPYDKQIEILSSVKDHRRVSVVGCNGSGKDWASARAVLWWVHSRYPAKAIVTGPTSRQVDDIVWNEIRHAYLQAQDQFGGQMYRTSRYQIDDQTFALGFTSDSPFNIQGFHSPNLLVVITEAHAVHQPYIDAVRRLNPSRLLMTGNPFKPSGAFFDSHHSQRHLYKTIQISAFDTPNVKAKRNVVPGMITTQDIEDRKEDWGEDTAMFIGSVLAEFPENLDLIVVPLWAATQAAKRDLAPEGPVILACDVARFGHDKTVVVRRQGSVARIIWRVRGHDTMAVSGFLKAYCDENKVDALVVDDTGIGAGVVDRLREFNLERTRLVPFIAGQRAHDSTHYVNRNTEVWWLMRKQYLAEDICTENDAALIGQVSSREYQHESDGRISLQSKEKLSKSPDEADALAMTFAVADGGVKIWV